MNDVSGTPQRRVDAYFDEVAAYWREVYSDQGLQGVVYRERMETVLRWVRDLGLPAGSAALDVGCGAGLLTAALAGIGLAVQATDSSPAMVEQASSTLAGQGLDVPVSVADVHALPFESGSFALVCALGVVPWLHDPAAAVAEMGRVLAPGGHLVLTADNRLRLNLLEPRENVLVAPLALARRRLRARGGAALSGAPARLHRPAAVDRMLARAGLEPLQRRSVGFGPLTFRGRQVLGERRGLSLHEALQRRADGGTPGLRRAGWHYVVLARRPPAR